MKIEADGFSFDFSDALDVFKFDEKDKTKPNYHGVTVMKAVDLIVELEDCYLFIELKNIFNPVDIGQQPVLDLNDLIFKLKYKFRDSYLYRHAEQKIDKPIHYICLIEHLDNAQIDFIKKTLNRNLPIGRASDRWQLELAKSCNVVNLQQWNNNFPIWPATTI